LRVPETTNTIAQKGGRYASKNWKKRMKKTKGKGSLGTGVKRSDICRGGRNTSTKNKTFLLGTGKQQREKESL